LKIFSCDHFEGSQLTDDLLYAKIGITRIEGDCGHFHDFATVGVRTPNSFFFHFKKFPRILNEKILLKTSRR